MLSEATMRRITFVCLSFLAATGCGEQAPPLDPAIRQRAIESIADTFGAPNRIQLQQAWLATRGPYLTLVCGRIAPPPMGLPPRNALRFVYDDRSHHGQVEFHEMIVADTASGADLIAQNRRLFDHLWDTECARRDPERSWLASLIG